MVHQVDGVLVFTTIRDQHIPHVADIQPGPANVKVGAQIEDYTVETAEPRRLILRARSGPAILKIVGGVLAFAIGAALAYKFFIVGDTSEAGRGGQKFAIVMLLAGPFLAVYGYLQMGEVAEFNGADQSFNLNRRGKVAASGNGKDGLKVGFVFMPQSSSERESVHLELFGADGKTVHPLLKARTDKPQGALAVQIGFAIARILNVPISVFGECTKGTTELNALVPDAV